jgi:hypothetical protein
MRIDDRRSKIDRKRLSRRIELIEWAGDTTPKMQEIAADLR